MSWKDCKHILCIRPDNMGDLIMTAPALRALKESFGCKITVLTSSMAQGVTGSIPEIDDTIIYDLPWVKCEKKADKASIGTILDHIKNSAFDAAIIFTVYSQNPLPAALLVYMAGIPKILAYCRENPYHLLTDWVPDKEPYSLIKHQVRRDLDLVAEVGAYTQNENLYLTVGHYCWETVMQKLTANGVCLPKPWLILHPGVSEQKRRYPVMHWINIAKNLIQQGYQVLLTGSVSERDFTDELQSQIGTGSFSIAGMLNLNEFICLVKKAPVIVSVNTGTVHIAAAVGTPVVVLYAQTNPQHTPWNVSHKILPVPVPAHMHSKNEVIAYVNKTIYGKPAKMPLANEVLAAIDELISASGSADLLFHEKPNESQGFLAS